MATIHGGNKYFIPKEVDICLSLGRENIFTAYPAEVKK